MACGMKNVVYLKLFKLHVSRYEEGNRRELAKVPKLNAISNKAS